MCFKFKSIYIQTGDGYNILRNEILFRCHLKCDSENSLPSGYGPSILINVYLYIHYEDRFHYKWVDRLFNLPELRPVIDLL